MSKRDIYKECCIEIIKIETLFPGFRLNDFVKEEMLDVIDGVPFLDSLKKYRRQLEMDNHVIQDDDETKKIIAEGMRIHSILIKQRIYGED